MVLQMESRRLEDPRLVKEPGRSTVLNGRSLPVASGSDLAGVPRLRGGDGNDSSVDAYEQNQELVAQYRDALSELTFNSKPIITNLTIIAGEYVQVANAVAATICSNIIEVPSDQKLPSLYLLDSIVKNIGRDYVKHFATRLPEVFCKAYRQVDPSLHQSMRHLFETWKGVFPPQSLEMIRKELGFTPTINSSSSGATSSRLDSQSQRPLNSIHVNPRYLERQRLQQSSQNIQHMSGSSSSTIYGEKSPVGYDENDSDNSEDLSSGAGAQGLRLTGTLGHPSLGPGRNKSLPSSTIRLTRPFSPSNVGLDRPLSPALNEFTVDDSPRRLVERPSSSHQSFDCGLDVNKDEEMTADWRRKYHPEENYHQFKTSTAHGLNNERTHDRTRALIDAYGDDRRKITSNNKLLKAGIHDSIVDSNVASWQNSEEEEFDWEDMSPTLADHVRNREFEPAPIPPSGDSRARPGFGTQIAAPSDDNYKRSRWPSQDHLSRAGHGSRSITQQTRPDKGISSRDPRDVLSLASYPSPSLKYPLNNKGREEKFQMAFSGIQSPGGEKMASLVDHTGADGKLRRPPSGPSSMSFSNIDSTNVDTGPSVVQGSTVSWPPVNAHMSQAPHLYPIPLQHKQMGTKLDLINATMNQGPNKSFFVPEQQFDNRVLNPTRLPQIGSSMNQHNQGQMISLRPQSLPSWDARGNAFPSSVSPVPGHLVAPPFSHGYITQRHGTSLRPVLPSPVRAAILPFPIQNIHNSSSLHVQGGLLPPMPPGPPPLASQSMSMPQSAGSAVSNQPSGGAFSGLITTLMAQGLISMEKQEPVQNSVGIEFDADLLKVRHESAISALYTALPRQCTTCGLRFKYQEEHRSHMDWHVTKNRMSKNRKQKPSRKWFVSTAMWLSGAEALGTDAVPGFLPTETVVDKKTDEEMAVPADEDQNVCALCGETFDDFYSDEMEEWMYKGAVYMNAPDRPTTGVDRSQLGPIVHVKCRNMSSVIPPQGLGQDGGEDTDEGSHRKRMRS